MIFGECVPVVPEARRSVRSVRIISIARTETANATIVIQLLAIDVSHETCSKVNGNRGRLKRAIQCLTIGTKSKKRKERYNEEPLQRNKIILIESKINSHLFSTGMYEWQK